LEADTQGSGVLITTTRGELALASLRKETHREPVPCGTAITTKYFAEDGELVRQDVEIQVSTAALPSPTQAS